MKKITFVVCALAVMAIVFAPAVSASSTSVMTIRASSSTPATPASSATLAYAPSPWAGQLELVAPTFGLRDAGQLVASNRHGQVDVASTSVDLYIRRRRNAC